MNESHWYCFQNGQKTIVFERYECVHYSHPHRCMAQGYHIAPLGPSCSGQAHILLELVANLHSTLRVYTIAIHIGAQVLKCSSAQVLKFSSCSSASSACALSLVPWALCLSALAPRARACVCVIRLERWIFQYPQLTGRMFPSSAHACGLTAHGSRLEARLRPWLQASTCPVDGSGAADLPAPWAPTLNYNLPPIIDKEVFALWP